MKMLHSMLDNDLYKFTMQQAVLHHYPDAKATYRFINRGAQKFNENFLNELAKRIEDFRTMQPLTDSEAEFLSKQYFIKPWYIEYLRGYRFNPDQITLGLKDEQLEIEISGPWHSTILWEVPLMAVISEEYLGPIDLKKTDQKERAAKKALILGEENCFFADFGTRRRRSMDAQKLVLETLKDKPGFVGTSNVFYAHKLGLRPIGTMAHEWVQAISALESVNHANRFMMQKWSDFYQGSLGIALTDTYGLRAFLIDFQPQFAKLFDGVRHDSGCPFELTDRMVHLYNSYHIDPKSKTIVFSDGLNAEAAVKIKRYCDKVGINCSFGIGTNFTNDFDDAKPLNMVIKLWTMNGMPVAKLSEDPSKASGHPKAIETARLVYG